MSATTPMMRQYLEIKADYPDAILFFRLGDFYEMFLDDAVTASRVLDITLTSRNKGAAEEVPLCGIPYHSCQPYIASLVENGYKVAICEQVEDPKSAKGIVRREVVRVVTPGLVVDTDTLKPKENNYLAALAAGSDGRWGMAVLDITTGEFRATEVSGLGALRSELAAFNPREILAGRGGRHRRTGAGAGGTGAGDGGQPAAGLGLRTGPGRGADPPTSSPAAASRPSAAPSWPAAIGAAGAILHYLEDTQKGVVAHVRTLQTYHSRDFMVLDDGNPAQPGADRHPSRRQPQGVPARRPRPHRHCHGRAQAAPLDPPSAGRRRTDPPPPPGGGRTGRAIAAAP